MEAVAEPNEETAKMDDDWELVEVQHGEGK